MPFDGRLSKLFPARLPSRQASFWPLLSGTAVQYAAAALLLVAVAGATESMDIEWTPEFVAALVWLVVPLSLGAVLLHENLPHSALDVVAYPLCLIAILYGAIRLNGRELRISRTARVQIATSAAGEQDKSDALAGLLASGDTWTV